MTEQSNTVRPLALPGVRIGADNTHDVRKFIPGGESIKSPIRYGDHVWNLEGYPFVNQTVRRIDFEQVPRRWRNIVKDWTLLRFNPDLARTGASGLDTTDVMASTAAAERRAKATTMIANVLSISVCLKVIDRNGWERMGEKQWTAFAVQLASDNPNASPLTLSMYARSLPLLWKYRGLLGTPDMFGGRPFGNRTPTQVFKVPAPGLNIERPAPEFCGPLLGLSLWILDHCAADILERLEALAAIPDRTHLPLKEQLYLITEKLREWEATGRPMPTVMDHRTGTPTASWALFVTLAGCSRDKLRAPSGEARREFRRIRDKVGFSVSQDIFGLPITEVPDADGIQRPWIDGLPPTKFNLGLDHWTCTLAYVCAFTIAMLTTVRNRELASLPHRCIVEGTYDQGGIDIPVTKMRGYLVKNRTTHTPATWVVSDDVARCVEIIHRLKKALGLSPKIHPETGEEVLLHPDLGRAHSQESKADTLSLNSQYLAWIKASGKHLATRKIVPALPDLPSRVSHRTIRITGIDAYASQAWGDALAAAQAHWSNRTVAHGYLGHLPRSVFVADPESIEEARQLLLAQSLLDVASDRHDDPSAVSGNGTGRLDAALTQANAYELATGPVTGQQLIRVAKTNQNLFIGEFTICVHGPGGLCGNENEADFKLCRPFACRNSATTRAQRARMELRRRGWTEKAGVFARARRKLEGDLPELAVEFTALSDAALRTIILADLPGRFTQAASEGTNDQS